MEHTEQSQGCLQSESSRIGMGFEDSGKTKEGLVGEGTRSFQRTRWQAMERAG